MEVTSLMGTNDEQKAEALRATRTSSQRPTSSRASKLARGMCRAKADDRIAAPVIKTRGKYMTTGKSAVWAMIKAARCCRGDGVPDLYEDIFSTKWET